jgi:hypothetical protein
MERFELTVVAQGSQSVWVALLVIVLLCTTVISLAAALAAKAQTRGNGVSALPASDSDSKLVKHDQ